MENENNNINLTSRRIKQMRLDNEWTQKDLAQKLGLKNDTAIANYEAGYSTPKDEIKLKMCELFNCTIDYLMGNSEFKTKEEEMNAYISLYHSSVFSKIIFETTELFNGTPITICDLQKISNIISKCSIENDEESATSILEKFLYIYIEKGRTLEEKEKIALALSKFIEKSTKMIYEEINNIHKKKYDNSSIDDVLNEAMIGMSKEEYDKLSETQKKQIRDFALFVKNQEGDKK